MHYNTSIDIAGLSCLHYTSSDGKVVNPEFANEFGANIIYNIYKNGQGTLYFAGKVTKIGFSAFSCRPITCSMDMGFGIEVDISSDERTKKLTSIDIPSTVIEIGAYAFARCRELKSVNIPDSVKHIGSRAFSGCNSLSSIFIPDSVKEIGSETFIGCNELKTIKIPTSVSKIGSSAFTDCKSLVSAFISSKEIEFGYNPFEGCENLEAFYGFYASEDNRCLIKDGVLISFAQGGLSTYSIPDTVSEIGLKAFSECKKLKNIKIPNSVSNVRPLAFENCEALV